MRIERNGKRRRLGRYLPGQSGTVEATIALPSVQALFTAPEIDPFSPHYDEYEDRIAIDGLAFELQADQLPSSVRATFLLPSAAIDGETAERVRDAVRRYCAKRLRTLDTEIRRVDRHGLVTLVLGFLAVIVLNAIARALANDTDDLVLAISDGLQVVSWVTLWFPVNLLVYDRWYYRREHKVYRLLEGMEISLAPYDPRPSVPAGRSTER